MTKNIRAHYATGLAGKIVAARLLPGTDLLTGIEEICKENNIQFGSITNCFGSLQRTGFFYLIPKPDSSVGVGYGDLKVVEGPIEFLNGTGVVCQRDNQYELHVHGTMCDKEGIVFGGHLVKGENPVLTVDLLITEIKEMDLFRKFDEETGGNQFYPVKKGEPLTTVFEK
ncbi:PPC domain-containing DNA-binding protein [Peribacillus acanthi]|uniref:PPC domain-containing DNA-binding protein n=1 Tax=Peribacillus acanthi TaxID=2171554 RepID=UPI000D3E30C8|nr:PPC domain-containing DNA-binding protein [Peribacillus acanthi]